VKNEIAGPRHVCAFFDGPEEEYRSLIPFAKACAKCGDRFFQFLDGDRKSERVRRLEEAGVDMSAAQGNAEVRSWGETYLRGGNFVIDEMLELAREVLERGPGIARARAWTNMEWAGRNVRAARELVEYERRVDSVIARTDAIVICAYRVGCYSAEVAIELLRAHPWILVDGKLEANPAHIPSGA
jgi:predicted  nucleic acid-binding Zn-ribbon protein